MTTTTHAAVTTPDDLAAGLFGHRDVPLHDGVPPTPAELDIVLEAAAAVPDHGFVRPWRFVVISSEGRARLADALAADVTHAFEGTSAGMLDKARGKAYAAPALVGIVASPDASSNVPRWEQVASAACTGYAMVLGAHAVGLGAIWKSTNRTDGAALTELCGCRAGEEILGWVLLGSKSDSPLFLVKRTPAMSASSSISKTRRAFSEGYLSSSKKARMRARF